MALVVIMRPELKHGGSTRFMYAFHEKKKKKKERTIEQCTSAARGPVPSLLKPFPLLVIHSSPRYLSTIASVSISLDFELVAIVIWPQFLYQLTSDFCIAYRSLAPLTSLHRRLDRKFSSHKCPYT